MDESLNMLREKVAKAVSRYHFHGRFRADDRDILHPIVEIANRLQYIHDASLLDEAVKQLDAGKELSDRQIEFIVVALMNIQERVNKRRPLSFLTPGLIGLLGLIATLIIGIYSIDASKNIAPEKRPSQSRTESQNQELQSRTGLPPDTAGAGSLDTAGEGPQNTTAAGSQDTTAVGLKEIARDSGFPRILVLATQLVVILAFFIDGRRNHKLCRRAQNASVTRRVISQFSHYLQVIWVSWIALYVLLIIGEITPDLKFGGDFARSVFELLGEFANNFASFGFLLAFMVLDQPSIELDRGDNRDRVFRNMRLVAVVLVFMCTAMVGAGNLLSLDKQWRFAFALPTAMFAGVAMALFSGRLDSKILEVPRGQIAVLYGYAVLQMAWPALRVETVPNVIWALIFLSSLVGKIVFWRVLDRLFQFDAMLLDRYLDRTAAEFQELTSRRRAWQVSPMR